MGKRKREFGLLILPCKYFAFADEQLNSKKQKYTALELKHHKKELIENVNCILNINQKM